jgi:hypothetical protein
MMILKIFNLKEKKMKIIVLFVMLILIGGQINSSKLASLPEVEKPAIILVKNGRLFVADWTVKLHLYSMKDFSYVKQISRKGEGPGELKYVPRFTLHHDYIFLYSSNKCVYFSRNGDYDREFIIKNIRLNDVFPVKENFVGLKPGMNKKNDNSYSDISIYTYTKDKEFKFKKVVYYLERPPQKIRGGKKDYVVINDYLGIIVHDDKIFVGDSTRGLFVAVFDANGKEINRVNILEIDKTKLTEQYKKEFMERVKRNPSYNILKSMYNIIIPEYFPLFYRFAVDNGKVYFLTYLSKNDKREMIIVDLKSKIFKRVFVPWVDNDARINFSIENDKFYYIMENEEEEVWELHMVEIK